MISLERAAQCIGRPVVRDGEKIGTVHDVTIARVWVKGYGNQEPRPHFPDNLDWESALSPNLRDAIVNNQDYEDAQVGYEGGGDERPIISCVYSSATANDDNMDHPLVVIMHLMRRAHQSWPLANPWLAYEIEEALGWATP